MEPPFVMPQELASELQKLPWLAEQDGQSESDGVDAEQEPSHCMEPLPVMPQEFAAEVQELPWEGTQEGVGTHTVQ